MCPSVMDALVVIVIIAGGCLVGNMDCRPYIGHFKWNCLVLAWVAGSANRE